MTQWSEENLLPGTVIRWGSKVRTVESVRGNDVKFTNGTRTKIPFMNRMGNYELLEPATPEKKKGFGEWIKHLEEAT